MPEHYRKERVLKEMESYGLIKKLNKQSYLILKDHQDKVKELKDSRDDPLGIV